MKHFAFAAAAIAVVGTLVTFACSVHETGGCEDDQNCPFADSGMNGVDSSSPPDSGANEAAADAGADVSARCDPSQTPAENACVIDDTLAIFVAPTGNDANAGTKEHPVATLARGLALAAATSNHRVIACADTYDEAVSISGGSADGGIAEAAGVSLFGGVVCPGADAGTPWSYSGAKVIVAPSAHGYALSVTGFGAAAVDIEDVEFDAQGGTAPGESSIAGFIDSSSNVILRSVKLVAGAGSNGADGTLTPVTYPAAMSLQGGAGAGNSGGAGCSFTCPAGGVTSGGTGGAGGGAGGDGTPGSPLLDGGAGQTALQCAGGNGTMLAGANASPSGDGAGAMNVGSVAGTTWQPAAGLSGTAGTPGQGGGGGGGSATGAGGGGGCGGCGGAGAGGGQGGGASVALFVLSSAKTIVLDSCTLIAVSGGAGGAGVAGQAGQTLGGAHGGSSPGGGGCQGGNGGAGGAGGGAGGVSAGILYQGDVPNLMNTAPMFASPGADGGAGGGAGNSGLAGMSAATISL